MQADARRKFEDAEKRPPYDADTQALVDAANAARDDYRNAETEFRNVDDEIRWLFYSNFLVLAIVPLVCSKAEEYAGPVFGADHAWAPLKGQCVELSDMQYTYRLCLFDRTSQKPKSGGGETSLGFVLPGPLLSFRNDCFVACSSWGHWVPDADHPSAQQLYENGQGCWNGPNRSTRVNINCGAELRLTSATEPAKLLFYSSIHFILCLHLGASTNSLWRVPLHAPIQVPLAMKYTTRSCDFFVTIFKFYYRHFMPICLFYCIS